MANLSGHRLALLGSCPTQSRRIELAVMCGLSSVPSVTSQSCGGGATAGTPLGRALDTLQVKLEASLRPDAAAQVLHRHRKHDGHFRDFIRRFWHQAGASLILDTRGTAVQPRGHRGSDPGRGRVVLTALSHRVGMF